MASLYDCEVEFMFAPRNGIKKVMQDRVQVRVPVKKWSRTLYDKMEQYLANKYGGGAVTIMSVKEVEK